MAKHNADGLQIFETKAQSSGEISDLMKAGRIRLGSINKSEAPFEETNLKVLLEITGSKMNKDRLGVDIVTVLDVTGSNETEKKLQDMKNAMKFLIKKLGPSDCLSLVTFSRKSAETKISLVQMTENNKSKIEIMVKNLQVVNNESDNNKGKTAKEAVVSGLQTALEVLNQRTIKRRVAAIMLVMSSCDPTSDTGNDIGIQVPNSNVPVYTFGLGPKYDEKILYLITKKSQGGTFAIADVENTPSSCNLSVAFSQCLASLLTVSVQDLILTITRVNSKFKRISAGDYYYAETLGEDVRTVTVSFGNVSSEEKRKVLVDLHLTATTNNHVTEVLNITYSYKVGEKSFEETKPLIVRVTRTQTPKEQEMEEITLEEARLTMVDTIREARHKADKDTYISLDEAQDKIVQVQNMLEDVEVNQPKLSLEMLKYELYELLRLMPSLELYTNLGRAFALAIQASHDRQKFAARKDEGRNQRMFATSFTDKYLEQVIAFEENPSVKVPTINDDFLEEVSHNPIAAFPVATLNYYLEDVIRSLEAMQDKINSLRYAGEVQSV